MLPHLRGRAAYLFSVIDRVRLDCRCAGGTTQTSRGREPPVIDSPLSPSPGKGRWKNSWVRWVVCSSAPAGAVLIARGGQVACATG